MALGARRYTQEKEYREESAPRIRVLDGEGKDAARRLPLAPSALGLFKLALVLILFFAAVCGVRVWFTVATVDEMITQDHLTNDIQEARELGADLEIQQTSLTNPETIKAKARELGMSASPDAAYFDMANALTVEAAAKDIVAPQSPTAAPTIATVFED